MSDYTPSLEALARLIDPEAWRDVQPHSAAFYDDPETQKTYEGFFWQGVEERRTPSLEAAKRIAPVIEAVRAEEREKAAQIAEKGRDAWADVYLPTAFDAIARLIREQGKEQGS